MDGDIQLRIGQLADLVGVTPKTIRHYHKIGLMPPPTRAENNYRQYNLADLYRLKLILRLKEVGFSLADIRSITGADDPDEVLWRRLEDLAQELDGRITELQRQKQRVQSMLAEGATLQDVDRAASQSSFTYELLADVLEDYMGGSPADVQSLDQALLARLDMFNWGDEYRVYWLKLAHSLADSVDTLRAVNDRIMVAGRLAVDDPQLEVIADDVAAELQPLQSFFGLPEMERPLQELFRQVVVQAIQETLTPAQQNLVGLIRKRLYD